MGASFSLVIFLSCFAETHPLCFVGQDTLPHAEEEHESSVYFCHCRNTARGRSRHQKQLLTHRMGESGIKVAMEGKHSSDEMDAVVVARF